MRDKTHEEQIERWANYIKKNPDWKRQHKKFIDSQILTAQKFYKNLLKTKEGQRILDRIVEEKRKN